MVYTCSMIFQFLKYCFHKEFFNTPSFHISTPMPQLLPSLIGLSIVNKMARMRLVILLKPGRQKNQPTLLYFSTQCYLMTQNGCWTSRHHVHV